MYSSLYPAVLGTVLLNVFVFLSKVVEGESISGSDFGIGKLVLTFGIVVHFIVDYILARKHQSTDGVGFGLTAAFSVDYGWQRQVSTSI